VRVSSYLYFILTYIALTKFALGVHIHELVDDIARGHSFWFFAALKRLLLSFGADDCTIIHHTTIRVFSCLGLDVLVRVVESIVDTNWSAHASHIQVW